MVGSPPLLWWTPGFCPPVYSPNAGEAGPWAFAQAALNGPVHRVLSPASCVALMVGLSDVSGAPRKPHTPSGSWGKSEGKHLQCCSSGKNNNSAFIHPDGTKIGFRSREMVNGSGSGRIRRMIAPCGGWRQLFEVMVLNRSRGRGEESRGGFA